MVVARCQLPCGRVGRRARPNEPGRQRLERVSVPLRLEALFAAAHLEERRSPGGMNRRAMGRPHQARDGSDGLAPHLAQRSADPISSDDLPVARFYMSATLHSSWMTSASYGSVVRVVRP